MVLGLAIVSTNAAKLKNKDIVGNWKYTVQIENGNLTGILKIVLVGKKLSGEVNDDQGNTFMLTKIEIVGEELQFELQPNEVVKAKVKRIESKLVGTAKIGEQEYKLVAEK